MMREDVAAEKAATLLLDHARPAAAALFYPASMAAMSRAVYEGLGYDCDVEH